MNSSANDTFDPTHSSDSDSDGNPGVSSAYVDRPSASSLNATLLADTLGLDYDLRAFVPFGSLGYLHVHGNKEDAKNVLVVIIGLNHDGHGYRAIRVADGTVLTSINIKAQ